MNIVATIVPIFSVVLLGWGARARGFMPAPFLGPANRLVFYLAIPAMIFSATSKGSLRAQFEPAVLWVCLGSIASVFLAAWAIGRLLCRRRARIGTFMQSTFHGNLGYVALAVAFYHMGQEGLVRASIIAGFIMILQNILAVVALETYGEKTSPRGGRSHAVLKILAHPVILSATAGILFSLSGAALPVAIDRSLQILGSLALPLALLLIGASLSLEVLRKEVLAALSVVCLMKLILLPSIGLILFRCLEIPVEIYLPALILLAAPTATLTYVMAEEMNGDPGFAVAAISACTLLSSISYAFWLHVAA
jgi:predicted permease